MGLEMSLFNETMFRVHVSEFFICMFYLYIKHIWMSQHPECQWKGNTSSDPLVENRDDFLVITKYSNVESGTV